MTDRFSALTAALLEAYRRALTQALPPPPIVARHWVSAERLTWLALLQEQSAFHFAWSFGQLKGTPLVLGQRQFAGVFRLAANVTTGVDHVGLARALGDLIPEGADGASRAFLQRVTAQLATAEVAVTLERERERLPMPTTPDFGVSVPLRADVLDLPALTPRLPRHAADRVEAAIAQLEPELQRRVRAIFAAPERALIDAVRGAR